MQDIEDINERIMQLKKQVDILEEATNVYTSMYKMCFFYGLSSALCSSKNKNDNKSCKFWRFTFFFMQAKSKYDRIRKEASEEADKILYHGMKESQ